ncbi:MAG TPA: hypothetical protein VF619_12135 [Allosphingosinicella sp.]|jgi:hypothetical protein
MKWKLALAVLAGLAASGAAGADSSAADVGTCSRESFGAAAIALRAAKADLMAVALGDPDTSIPPATGRKIEAVKDRLRVYVQTAMACAPTSVEPETLAAAMEQRAGTSDSPGDPGRPEPDRHGGTLTYEVARVKAHPDMLAVVTTLGIKCGSDSMLMLYRRTRTGWEELMVRRAEPYREVSGGWQDLRFAVSPADARGQWFVATVSTTPWCSSSWQGLRYALARAADDPGRPKVLLDEKTTTWLGAEEELNVRAEEDAFELRHVAGSIDPAVHSRPHVRRYAVSSEAVRRVPPVADSARDFVDEWIASPWAEAKDWSASDPRLAGLHAQLNQGRYELLGEFASIRACRNGRTQVEIRSEKGPGWFFLVRDQRDSPWWMEQARRKADPRCSGHNSLGREPARD